MSTARAAAVPRRRRTGCFFRLDFNHPDDVGVYSSEDVAVGGYRLTLWDEDRLLIFIVTGVSALSSWMWWVPIRCVMDGPGFQWVSRIGAARLEGAGMGGHFPVLVLLATLFIAIVYLGWRGAPHPFKPLLLIWCSVSFGGSLYLALENPEGYRFRGDTMGIDVNLAIAMPLLKGMLLALVVYWLYREFRYPRTRAVPEWLPLNRALLIPILLALPLQIALLRFGPMHDWTDKLGWILTYSEWILLNLAFMPWVRREPG